MRPIEPVASVTVGDEGNDHVFLSTARCLSSQATHSLDPPMGLGADLASRQRNTPRIRENRAFLRFSFSQTRGISWIRREHAPALVSAVFDDPHLVWTVDLVPLLRLAEQAWLAEAAQDRLSVPADKGSNAGAKVSALVAEMLACATRSETSTCSAMAGWDAYSTGSARQRRRDRFCGVPVRARPPARRGRRPDPGEPHQ